MQVKVYKISFCIVCMNRLHHLEQTLLTNILDNADYPNLEFVLLDYNSSDQLELYIQNHMQQYIDQGRLVYYRTSKPAYFKRSHSRNLVFKLATGDLLCNLDADNYTGKGFASYLNQAFQTEEQMFLTVIGKIFKQDVLGRICLRKTDFYKVRGYDEKMVNYGFEDYDFANRLEISGLKRVLFPDEKDWFRAVPHTQEDRLSNEFVSRNLKHVLISYQTPSSSDLLYLFAGKKFERYLYLDHQTYQFEKQLTPIQETQMKYKFSFTDAPFRSGTWEETTEGLLLNHYENYLLVFHPDGGYYQNPEDRNRRFYKFTDPDVIREAIMMYSQMRNRLLMEENKLNGKAVVNPVEFGKDEVCKNFNAGLSIAV